MEDFLWEKEVETFVEALRKAGIKTFVYTNQSTAVMENLHQLAAAGCTMQGLCTITRQETRWGDEEPTEVMGIRFTIGFILLHFQPLVKVHIFLAVLHVSFSEIRTYYFST